MIKRVSSQEELTSLPKTGVEAQKIHALLLAYGTKYDFCKFYILNNLRRQPSCAAVFFFCEMNGSFVLCETSQYCEQDIEELSSFFLMQGFSEIFCSNLLGIALSNKLHCKADRVNLMYFNGTSCENTSIDRTPPLDEVFKILETSFDIDYEQWYVDMSHRIRHKIAKARRLKDSVLIIQHDLNGEALLSQIATLPEKRGTGNASRLIGTVCAELSDSKVFVLCEDELLNFYRRNGFIKTADKMILKT